VLTSTTRSQKAPDIPTAAEMGHPVLEGDQWVSILAPAGTPGDIVGLLHRGITGAAALPDVKNRLTELDFYAIQGTPEDFAARIRSELDTWRQVVREVHFAPG
jgi:tripartite-type tricarboxylate transporter receptor subunit TctC